MTTEPRHSLAERPPRNHVQTPGASSRGATAGLESVAELARRLLDCEAAVVRIGGLEGPDRFAAAVRLDGASTSDRLAADPRRLADPSAAEDLGLRFYAGVPLRADGDSTLGVLAAVDGEPREMSEDTLETLKLLAAVAAELVKDGGGYG